MTRRLVVLLIYPINEGLKDALRLALTLYLVYFYEFHAFYWAATLELKAGTVYYLESFDEGYLYFMDVEAAVRHVVVAVHWVNDGEGSLAERSLLVTDGRLDLVTVQIVLLWLEARAIEVEEADQICRE